MKNVKTIFILAAMAAASTATAQSAQSPYPPCPKTEAFESCLARLIPLGTQINLLNSFMSANGFLNPGIMYPYEWRATDAADGFVVSAEVKSDKVEKLWCGNGGRGMGPDHECAQTPAPIIP